MHTFDRKCLHHEHGSQSTEKRRPFGRLSNSQDPLDVENVSSASFRDTRPFAGRSRRDWPNSFTFASDQLYSVFDCGV